MRKLTDKQEAFCRAYLELNNKSDAYRQAYNSENMKAETINHKAHHLFKQAHVSARIEQLQAEAAKRHDLTVDDILKPLKAINNAKVSDYFTEDENGLLSFKSLDDISEDQKHAIESLELDESGRVKKFKLYSKLVSIDKIAKHLGWYEKDNQQKTSTLDQPLQLIIEDMST